MPGPEGPRGLALTGVRGALARAYSWPRVIYCVIPPELKDELFDKLVEYYKDNPNVEVIVDRRSGPDRRQGAVPEDVKERRTTRDRRRSRVPGTFPEVEPPAA